MKLTLTYRSLLPPARKGVSPTKAALRTAFHPQIEAQVRPRLGDPAEVTTEFLGQRFVSPAHERVRTAAELDVLLLTPRSTRSVGDTDNRLKTLIDGLTRPANPEQMQDLMPAPDGGPTYCLMDDDRLVKRLTVDARPWYESTTRENESLVIVTATVVLGENADMSSPTQNIFLAL